MKVIYDCQIFAAQEFGGISRYVCSLASQMSGFSGVEARIVAPIHINGHLKSIDASIAVGCYVRRLPKTSRMIKAVSAALCGPIASALRPDLVHETYYAQQSPCRSKVPHVLTVYDMIEERFPASFPDGYPVARLKRAAVNRADHVFCISENTRRDLMELYRLGPDRISVTYLGYDQLPVTGLTASDLVGESPYILHVAGRHGYKNFEGLLRAYAASGWLKSHFRIVCFGAAPFSLLERSLFAQLGLPEEKVTHCGGSDERLAALYKGAAVLVYPSKYEGFGIPPLEAMSQDCPVICSSSSSIPEVVGNAGEYFDADEPDSIRAAMEKVLQSPERRDELVLLGRDRCKLFTWTRCAQETLDVYRRLAA